MEILLTRLHELRTHVCHVQRLAEGRGTPHALREAHSYQHVPRGAEEVAGAQRPSRRPLREKAVGIAGSSSIVRRRPDLGLKEILRREGEQGQRVAASQSNSWVSRIKAPRLKLTAALPLLIISMGGRVRPSDMVRTPLRSPALRMPCED